MGSSLGASEDEVVIRGALARTTPGTVDVAQVRDLVADRFTQGARVAQFRDFSLTSDDTMNLCLNPTD